MQDRSARTSIAASPRDQRRLLCVSPYFPPLMNAEAIVTAKVINELALSGVDVTVISAAYPKDNADYWFDESRLWRNVKSLVIPIPHHADAPKVQSAVRALTYQVSSWARWLHAVIRRASELHAQRPF